MTTLAELAREQGVTPQAVGKWRDSAIAKYGDLPYDQVGKRKEYAPNAVARILEFSTLQPTHPTSDPVAHPVTVEVGNHATALAVPDLSSFTADLGAYRDDTVTSEFIEDPLALADQVAAIASQVMTGMDNDIAARKERLKRTQEAKEQVTETLEDLKAKRKHYRQQTRNIDTVQSDEAGSLQDAIAALQSLGKPSDGSTT